MGKVKKIERFGNMKSAENTFTDRAEPRAEFWNMYNTMEPDEFNAISFYGVGGIGKTRLLSQLQNEMLEKSKEEKTDIPFISYSFETEKTGTDMKSFLFTLSRRMMVCNPKLNFRLFDEAFIKYCELTGEDYKKIEEELNSSFLDNDKTKDALSIVSSLIPIPSMDKVAWLAGKGFLKLTKCLQEQIEKRDVQIKLAYNSIKNCSDPKEILERLPDYFILDACENNIKIVVMLDGYEKLVSLLKNGDNAFIRDKWLCGEDMLVSSIPNILWVVSGREKIRWSKELLPSENQHRIGNLSEADTYDYLEKCEIRDNELKQYIFQLTNGVPAFLDVCVKKYNLLILRNEGTYKPAASDFGSNLDSLIQRYTQDMSNEQQDLLHLISCLPRAFDEELLMAVARKVNYATGEFKRMCELSIFEKNGGNYKLHDRIREIILQQFKKNHPDKAINLIKNANQIEKERITSEANITLIAGKAENWFENYEELAVLGAFTKEDAEAMAKVRNKFYHAVDYENAYKLNEKLISVLEKTPLKNTLLRQKARHIRIMYALGSYPDALSYGEALYREELLEKLVSAESATEEVLAIADVISEYAIILRCVGNYKKATELTEKVLEARMKFYKEEHPDTIHSLDSLANCYTCLGNYQKALELSERVYELSVKLLGEEHPNTIHSLHNLAVRYTSLGNCQKALELSERAYELYAKVLGEEHPDTIRSLNNLALQYASLENYPKAFELSEKAYEQHVKILGEEHPDTIRSLYNLALRHASLGNCQKALELSEKAYELRVKILGEEHPDTIRSLGNLALLYGYSGNCQKALELSERTYELDVKILGEEHPDTIASLDVLAGCHAALGNRQKAIELSERTYELSVKILGEEHPDTIAFLHNLANRK